MLSLEQGSYLAKLARSSASDFTTGKVGFYETSEKWLHEPLGVFTTIHSFPDNELRGCIGFPIPFMSLAKNVMESAKSACHDPRFSPVKHRELDEVIFEISVLSKPEKITFSSANELLKKITPGKDGLIIEYESSSGLFLPQVWEQLPSKESFLDNLCIKAGLPKGHWKMKGVSISRFRCQIFKEQTPNGKITEIK